MRYLRSEHGFTVAEVLVAAVVVAIAVVALLKVVPTATYAVQEGSQLSTATFLADQKLEQVKSLPWTATPAPGNDCLGISASANAAPTVPPAATCTFGGTTVAAGGALSWETDESATAIPTFNGYSRWVRVTDCGIGAGCMGIVDSGMRLVTVTVSYTPLNTAGTKSYSVSMLHSQR